MAVQADAESDGARRLGQLRCCALAGALLWLTAVVLPFTAQRKVAAATLPPTDVACAGCHKAIYDKYQRTPMALASGPAVDGIDAGGFSHAASGVTYRMLKRDGAEWLRYTRPAGDARGYLDGEVRLEYFIGSNTRGRTYLFEREGYWFEAPVNWYAKKKLWDMAPNFQHAHEVPLTLPVDANCLSCHATAVAASLPDARNHFAGAPFAQGGVRCAACHGDATEHVSSNGRAAVLNPATLDAPRRDAVCLQCHLEGETAIYRLGHSLAGFHPGDALFDSVSYFVHRGEPGKATRASSQYEALMESACKRASGDALTCTTCHDPHGSETTETKEQRVAYYRLKCLSCHTGVQFATTHHPEQPDCARCHMPRSASEDIAHEQVTDHRIQIPEPASGADKRQLTARSEELVPVGDEAAGPRELGLAYAQFAERGDRASTDRALALLHQAERMPATLPDPALHTALGVLEQMSGKMRAADQEYRAALEADSHDEIARGNLAVLFAQTGDYATAVKLWQRVFAADPGESAAGYNLAAGECRLGQRTAALATLERLLQFAPDDQHARALSTAIEQGTQRCTAAQP